jgi:predicted NBD/HSP70 family sugar kinase
VVSGGAPGPRLRDVNRIAVLSLIGRYGPISRADVARRLGLSPATLTTVTRGLMDAGLIRKVDDDASRGGRPGELLSVVGAAASAIGVKVTEESVIGVRADLDGRVLETFQAPFGANGSNPFESLADLLRPHVETADGGRLLGVGLGLAGFVHAQTGMVEAPLLGWRHMPLGDYLERLLGVPVVVDNDVNTLAAFEHLYGLGRSYDDFLTITLGRGVGAAVVIGGDLRRGAHGAAGEFGHMVVDPAGPACHCGKRGCLETYVSDGALLAAAGLDQATGRAPMLAAAERGDERIREVYRVAGARLGNAAAGLCAVLDPQAVLVSGEGTQAWPFLSDGFLPAFRAGLFPPLAEAMELHVDPWDDVKWARGAAALALRAPFTAALGPDRQADAIRARLDVFAAAGAES